MIISDNFLMALGDRLKAARKAIGMTQQQLAEKTGVSQGLISDLEKNVYPTSSHVPKMASILKVDALYLSDGVMPHNEVNQQKSEYKTTQKLIVAGKEIPPLHELMVEKYLKLSGASQNIIDLFVNRLYSLEHPDDLTADPTNGKKKRFKNTEKG